jgi:hypothetical protein
LCILTRSSFGRLFVFCTIIFSNVFVCSGILRYAKYPSLILNSFFYLSIPSENKEGGEGGGEQAV